MRDIVILDFSYCIGELCPRFLMIGVGPYMLDREIDTGFKLQ